MKQIRFLLFVFSTISLVSCSSSEKLERPCIWVKQSDRDKILEKIEQQAWAREYYASFVERVQADIEAHQQNPDEYLRALPLDWENQIPGTSPPFLTKNKRSNVLPRRYLHTALDCGIIYFLEEDNKYAQYATDVLNAFVLGLTQIETSDDWKTGSWFYWEDNLMESKNIGALVPVVYDFVAPFIAKGGLAYNLGSKSHAEFPYEKAQQVFRTYASLSVDHGIVGCNWPVLESDQLVHNALAIDDKKERNKFIKYYLTESTAHQDALNKVAESFVKEGDVAPESVQYSNFVSEFSTHLMYLFTKFDPSLHLGQKYPLIPLSLDRWTNFVYPNGEIIRFGDGFRNQEISYRTYEIAYQLGKMENIPAITDKFGSLLNSAIANGDYDRGKLEERSYFVYRPKHLLWSSDEIEGEVQAQILPRTADQAFAGIVIQRNAAPGMDPEDGLMCYVGGAHHVHGHASGMNIELYGKGEALGVDHGRGSYRRDLHENYSRLFAAHNTVIVNGSSRSDSGWVNLGINTVYKIAMEPLPFEEALSPDYSFSRTGFVDDMGDKAEALQERTLALIRTSESTGYYVDVFRSKSKLPDEFHDYLYHNIGDELVFRNKDMVFQSDPERYMANANDPWIQNSSYRHPGWHFFEQVETSGIYSGEVLAQFKTEKIEDKKIFMNLFIPGSAGREYTRVMAPRTFEAPSPYDKLATPTLVIRQKGEAWERPFVLVYEPVSGKPENTSIQSLENILHNGVYKGIKIISRIDDATLVQYVLTQSSDDIYDDERSGIHFRGGFGLITTQTDGTLLNMYLGDGKNIQYGDTSIKSSKGKDVGVFIDFTGDSTSIQANGDASVSIRGISVILNKENGYITKVK